MSCKVCAYNQFKDIDRALLAGTTPAALSKYYKSFSPEMLARHQEHLNRKIALAQKRFHASLHQGLFLRLNTVMEMVLQVVRKTKNAEDPKLFLQATREFTRVTGLMEKMAAKMEFDPEFVYCLMDNMQWNLQEDAMMPEAYQALALTRQNMRQTLFAPCPEPEPEAESAPASEPLPQSHPLPSQPAPAGSIPEPFARHILLTWSACLTISPNPKKFTAVNKREISEKLAKNYREIPGCRG